MPETQEKYTREATLQEIEGRRKVVEGLRQMKEVPAGGYGEVLLKFENFEIVQTQVTKKKLW